METRLAAGCPNDFVSAETEIAARLSATPERCAFLRSSAYLSFRMRALYKDPNRCSSVYAPSGMRIDYTPGPSGGYITLGPDQELELHAPEPGDPIPENTEWSNNLYQSYMVCVPIRGPGRPPKTACL